MPFYTKDKPYRKNSKQTKQKKKKKVRTNLILHYICLAAQLTYKYQTPPGFKVAQNG